ncbi:MAG: hypothetical protein OHK0015_11440 [Chloroflexi bacterium OHK40]
MRRLDEYDPTLDEAALTADEAATRALLARWGEPVAVAPPRDLAVRVLASLPAERQPATGGPARWPRAAALLTALAFALWVALGAWGVLGNSMGPARVAGGPDGGLGQLLLTLTLAAKPLVNLLAAVGPAALLVPLVLGAGAWLWWRLVRGAPLAMRSEPGR